MKIHALEVTTPRTTDSLASLSEQTARYGEAGLQGAPNTDLRHFTHWCQANRVEPVPATVDTSPGTSPT